MGGYLFSIVLTVHVLVGLGVIGLVLLQHGKGADAGAAFGSGSSGSLFGASGSANFMSRTTAVLATVFFITSLSLSYLGSRQYSGPTNVMEQGIPSAVDSVPTPSGESAPAGDSKLDGIPK
jgi:preprotein translocase subunit SecG